MKHDRNNPEKSTYAMNNDRIASLDALGFDWTPESGEPLHLHLYRKND